MKQIAFTCPWGMGSKELLHAFKLTTPNGDGIWEDLIGVDSIYNADWIVVAEDLDPSINISKIDHSKLILIQREPPWVSRSNWSRYNTKYKFRHSCTKNYTNTYNLGEWSFDVSYKDMKDYKRCPRNKKVCVITSNKRMVPGQVLRMDFIKQICRAYPGVLDVYGVGMDTEGLGYDYKGVSTFGDDTKLKWLSQYDYTLSLENGQGNGYFTEKILDAFMAHTVPIYWGAPDINNYFSSKSFYNLDITKPDAIQQFLKIISTPVSNDTIRSINNSREKIMNTYNWWPTIKRIIDTGHVLG